jgi:hypothetical protein
MGTRTRRLTGPGYLSGGGYHFQVHYSLTHRSDESSGAANQTITGTVELPAGVSLPIGQQMVLTLHDGNKVKVIGGVRRKDCRPRRIF